MSLDMDKFVKSDREYAEFSGPGEFAAVVTRNGNPAGKKELLRDFMKVQRSVMCVCPECQRKWPAAIWTEEQALRLLNFARFATLRQFWDRLRAEYLAFVATCPECGVSGRLPEQLHGSTEGTVHNSHLMFGQLITTSTTARRTAG